MARQRKGGFGGVAILLAGVWLISQVVGREEPKSHDLVAAVDTQSPTTKIVASADSDAKAIQTNTEVITAEPATTETPRWIKGNKVALRAGPGTGYSVLDRYSNGRSVTLLFANEDWSKVRDNLTRREGWIATRLLSESKPVKRKPHTKKEEPKREPLVVATPKISDAEIIKRLIAESIASYSGNCPCPFNRDRAGRRCGKRSAHSRPGGESPICFAGDVTPGMIASFRNR